MDLCLFYKNSRYIVCIVPTFYVGMQPRRSGVVLITLADLNLHIDAERLTRHYHAERGNDEKLTPRSVVVSRLPRRAPKLLLVTARPLSEWLSPHGCGELAKGQEAPLPTPSKSFGAQD